MDYTEFRDIFLQLSKLNGIPEPNDLQMQRFYDFTELLCKVNQTTNLTAIRNIPDIIAKHFVDSLLVMDLIPQNARMIDIGCGPGFPSLPLAIMREDLKITALDSTQKKISFVQTVSECLGLKNVTAISARAEDHSLIADLGGFDVVVSRAVARLNILSELALPYVKQGGTFIALKSAKAEEELTEAHNAISVLGGDPASIIRRDLYISENSSEERNFVVTRKNKLTPSVYPRIFATIKKKPL